MLAKRAELKRRTPGQPARPPSYPLYEEVRAGMKHTTPGRPARPAARAFPSMRGVQREWKVQLPAGPPARPPLARPSARPPTTRYGFRVQECVIHDVCVMLRSPGASVHCCRWGPSAPWGAAGYLSVFFHAAAMRSHTSRLETCLSVSTDEPDQRVMVSALHGSSVSCFECKLSHFEVLPFRHPCLNGRCMRRLPQPLASRGCPRKAQP